MRFAILGPVELCDGKQRVAVAGRRQLGLLALLLLQANRPVSADLIIDALWREQPAHGALKRLQMTVSRLRVTLDSQGWVGEPALSTVAGGYMLRVREGELDADVFRSRVEEGRVALAAAEPARAAEVLREALALWRGRPLAQVAFEEFAQTEIRRLEELWHAALQARIEADLRLGRHAELIGELEALAVGHPTRERLVEQLMLALYRVGRQADALDVFQRTRARLAEELGLTPGPGLVALQRKILEQSASLDALIGPDDATSKTLGAELRAPNRSSRPATDGMASRAVGTPVESTTTTPTPTVPDARRQDSRRVVSVLAARADVGDPELLHRVFERCAALIGQYGGTTERYLGDVLVGFFGLTESHGDEGLRAARAAVELSAATSELGLGLESGEVFLSTGAGGASIVTGVAITAAAELARRATPGEILLGEQLRQTVAADSRIDPTNNRLVALELDRPALLRAPPTSFVGRTHELDTLHLAFARVCADAACRLVTVVGPPGIGKSRLVGEFVAALGDDATVFAGRCLVYGEGTTYRALADIVRSLEADPRRRIEKLLADNEQAVRGILGAIGRSHEPTQPEETAWAVRRLLERLARDRPLVVAIEDIHWAEPPLLDLLDSVAAALSGSAVLLVCLTRPELLEARPEWASPQPNRSILMLEGLPDRQACELAAQLGASRRSEPIARRAEGNPLFIEQLAVVDAGQNTSELPANIQAVLAARIDRLDEAERTLLQLGAVEGRTFHASAVAAMLPERDRVGIATRLVALARKGLIGSDRPEYVDEEAFRFSHVLVQEVAYAGLPKVKRVDLHAKAGEWLEGRPGAADEVIAFHLEQACALAAELARAGEREREFAARAVTRFRSAAAAALGRGDPAAASDLLKRAMALIDSDAARCALLPALGASLFEAGELTEASNVLDDAIANAEDPLIRARAQVERQIVRLETEPDVMADRSVDLVDSVLPLLERAGDDYGQCRAWSLRALTEWGAGRVVRADEAWGRAADHARRAGEEREQFDVLGWRATAAVLGPAPVVEAIALCEEFREVVSRSPVAVAWIINPLASLHAMRGEVERAERYLQEADDIFNQLGGLSASVPHLAAYARLTIDQPALAEAALRVGCERLTTIGDSGALATTMAMLAQAVYAQGRTREAGDLCCLAADGAAADDIYTHVIWRGVQAKVLAREERCEQALALVRDALTLVERTDWLSLQGDAMLDLAHVLTVCSRTDEAAGVVTAALRRYKQKGNLVGEARARSLLGQRSEESNDVQIKL